MAEMSKRFTYILIGNIVVAILYGFLYLLIPEMTAEFMDRTTIDLQYLMLWGGTCLSLGIGGMLALIRREWDNLEIFIEFVIIWLFFSLIINVLTLFFVKPRSATNITFEWLNNIIFFAIIVIDIFFFYKEKKL